MRQRARTQPKKLSKQQAEQRYDKLYSEWLAGLQTENQELCHSLRKKRGSEIHIEKIKTVTKKKASPIIPALLGQGFPHRSERSRAHAAHYVTPPPLVLLVSQQMSPYSPDIAEALNKELGVPPGTNAWEYVQEHHLDIAGVLQAAVKVCDDYTVLLDGLISHFEQSAP